MGNPITVDREQSPAAVRSPLKGKQRNESDPTHQRRGGHDLHGSDPNADHPAQPRAVEGGPGRTPGGAARSGTPPAVPGATPTVQPLLQPRAPNQRNAMKFIVLLTENGRDHP